VKIPFAKEAIQKYIDVEKPLEIKSRFLGLQRIELEV